MIDCAALAQLARTASHDAVRAARELVARNCWAEQRQPRICSTWARIAVTDQDGRIIYPILDELPVRAITGPVLRQLIREAAQVEYHALQIDGEIIGMDGDPIIAWQVDSTELAEPGDRVPLDADRRSPPGQGVASRIYASDWRNRDNR